METAKLKKFAQFARRSLLEQVSAKLKLVLADSSAARREQPAAIKKLEEAIKDLGKEQVIERVAYIWFNRFCALRFMDVNRFTRIGVVSPLEDQTQPEILAEAKAGHLDEEMVNDKVQQKVFALLDGKAPSRDPQGEAYRLLVVAACNFWNKAMPFLFQRIDDYTELLMPDDLLSGNSILAYTREAMTPDACEDVEVIGWLYQFYISEKKDEVFDGLKKNKKITPENIPAATQLFTPHWIVRYLVENSLGRLWLLNRPGSKLVEQMDYYIKPEQAETDFLRIAKPEEIKICDPACGSGHMLTYAFDLLYTIYEEEGYEPGEIPEKILTHNLYGIEIDERAGELAAFALTMKARGKQRRFFNKAVKLNICVLENIHFDSNELSDYMDFIGRDLFTASLQTTLRQFEEADNFGSLIHPDVTDVDGTLSILESKNVSGQLFISMTHQKVLQALRQADYLSPKYHVVIANPPYMGSGGMNPRLATWASENYPNAKSDLFAMFIERSLDLTLRHGSVAMITMQSWMFLSSFEHIRQKLVNDFFVKSLVQIGFNSFPELNSKVAQACAFVVGNEIPRASGTYFNLNDAPQSADKNDVYLNKKSIRDFYVTKQQNFSRIKGTPFSYWASPKVYSLFDNQRCIDKIALPKQGSTIGNNDHFLRMWFELGNPLSSNWKYSTKGGDFRRWYGNSVYVVNWGTDGEEIRATGRATIRNSQFMFCEGIEWSRVTSSLASFRSMDEGFFHESASGVAFPPKKKKNSILGLLNTKLTSYFLNLFNQTITFQSGDVSRIPYIEVPCESIVERLVKGFRLDWDSFETSWDFTIPPLLNPNYRQLTLKASYQKLRTHWRDMSLEMQRLEEENNRIFIEAYGLQDELKPEVPLNEITLTCNPHYRYGKDKSENELEALLLADTMRELVSYAVGCMFGRYALDKSGLILANQGESIEDYLKRVPESSFPADDDNVIPMLDGDWFTDDIAERFRKFLRVAFGEEHYVANLQFVEQGLNIKGKRNYSIRDYFLSEFYADHVKRYKKRPIYWLFSSPKGSFNALIYMHRYRPDTVSVVLNDYLREFRTKLTSHKNHLEAVSISVSAAQGEKTKALKEIEKITKMITEMEDYEREVLYPLATEQMEIDLNDGVKVNYPKFGVALKKIVGLDAEED